MEFFVVLIPLTAVPAFAIGMDSVKRKHVLDLTRVAAAPRVAVAILVPHLEVKNAKY